LIIALVHTKTGFSVISEQVASVPKSTALPAAKASVANVRRRRVPMGIRLDRRGAKRLFSKVPAREAES
jgi:hypothetical protein